MGGANVLPGCNYQPDLAYFTVLKHHGMQDCIIYNCVYTVQHILPPIMVVNGQLFFVKNTLIFTCIYFSVVIATLMYHHYHRALSLQNSSSTRPHDVIKIK